MQPYDYTSAFANTQKPFQAFGEGLAMGDALVQLQQKRQAEQQAMQAAKQRAEEVAAARQKYLSLDEPTARDAIEFATYLPPELIKALNPMFESAGKAQVAASLGFMGQVLSSLEAKRPDVAISLLEARAGAEKNPKERQVLQTLAEVAKVSPAEAFRGMAPLLGAHPEGKAILEAIAKARESQQKEALAPIEIDKAKGDARAALAQATTAEVTAQNAPVMAAQGVIEAAGRAQEASVKGRFAEQEAKARLEQAGWNIKNLQNQISVNAQRLQLDRQRTNAEVMSKLAEIGKKQADIPADVRKLINETAVSSSAATQDAEKFRRVAEGFAKEKGGGTFGKLNEYLKAKAGMQNGMTALRNEYDAIRGQLAIERLPPGAASNADMEFAQKAFLESTAKPEEIAKFLRGFAVMKDIQAAQKNAQVDWLAANNGTLGRAKSGFEAGGLEVKQGEDFSALQAKLAAQIAQKSAPTKQKIVDVAY